jgi:hypothetical protein
MRTLFAWFLIIAGCCFAAQVWLPSNLRLTMSGSLDQMALPAGIIAAALGMILLFWRAPRRPTFSDAPIVSALIAEGFQMSKTPDSWQASGTWKGVPLVVRRSAGHAAGRFGRPWTIVVSLPGQPIEPWPYLPEEGLIVELRDHGFSVAMADLSRPECMHRISERLNQLVQLRH